MKIDGNALDILIEASCQNMLMCISSGGILGISTPVTIESATIITHAELLAAIALTQLVRPGVQTIYSNFLRSMDMRTMTIQMSSPETLFSKSVGAELGRFLNLPTMMSIGLRDSKILDAQAGFETGMAGVIGALTSDFFIGAQLDNDMVVDYADLPYMDECMRQFHRLVKGLDFSEERIDIENILDMGHGGNYLESPHTLTYYKEEIWMPDLKEHGNWDKWQAAGGKTMEEKCVEKVKSLLEEVGPVKCLTDDQETRIDAILQGATDKAKGARR
jgi:trimethylamine--corrinoid protein Co-methyltransferase